MSECFGHHVRIGVSIRYHGFVLVISGTLEHSGITYYILMSDMMYVVLSVFWPQKMGKIDRKQADLQNFFLAEPLIYGTCRTHHTYFCLKNSDAPTDGKSTGKKPPNTYFWGKL